MQLELVSNELPDKVLATSEVVSIHVRDLPQKGTILVCSWRIYCLKCYFTDSFICI